MQHAVPMCFPLERGFVGLQSHKDVSSLGAITRTTVPHTRQFLHFLKRAVERLKAEV